MASSVKTARRNLRVAPADDSLIVQAADALGQSVSTFMIESARSRAEITLADRTHFVLDDAAWSTFVEALDRPAEANPVVVDLLRRPRPE